MAVDHHSHRAGVFKQKNKTHKTGRHRSKGAIDNENKGKSSLKATPMKHRGVMRREHRRQQSNQLRKNKRDAVIAKKRCLGTAGNAPFLVCVLPLNASIDPKSALYMLEKCDAEAQVNKTASGVTYITLPRFKQRFTFVIPPVGRGMELTTLDYLKVCDTTLLLLSANVNTEEDDLLDRWGHRIYNMAMSQGIPTPIFALQDLESIAPKRRQQTKAAIQKFIERMMPDEKVMMLDTDSDALNMLRKIGAGKKNVQHNRMNRAHLYGEQVEYEEGNLKVSGFLRGIPLDVNQLVHIPGLGDFQLSQIDGPADPFPMEKRPVKVDGVMETEVAGPSLRVLAKADPNLQASLVRENEPDEMDQEQPFPTDEEIAAAQLENLNKKKLMKRVPKGTSAYQACWIPDAEDEEGSGEDEDSDDGEEDPDDDFMSCESDKESVNGNAGEEMSQEDEEDEGVDEEYEDVQLEGSNDHKYDEELDLHEELATLAKMKAAKTDQQWPDELDTPLDTPAAVRFQKYRGLESFRSSPWDVKENLPRDYSRIFQFKNFDRTKRRIISQAKDELVNDGVPSGTYVTLHVKNVDEKLWAMFQAGRNNDQGLIVYGMLPHEQQMCVQNCVLKRTPDSELPLQSKERMIVQCGYRRFIVNPIFSQHTNADKHKFERFFRPGETVVATFYAPIQFPPAPVLCFRENPDTSLTMVANGVLMSCTPDRVVLKRIVISGHPLKINRKVATVRYMFFNKDDVDYFKPIKLRTKCGRQGHIRESLGTHGHMKCVFDGQLKSYDTVLMYLYKRVFPKWTYQDLIVAVQQEGDAKKGGDAEMKE